MVKMAEVTNSSLDKRPRKRLKKLTVDICHQIEFYFSDANLRKDRFLQREMVKSDQGYISVDVIASFNKIRNMTTDKKMVVTAIQQSGLLELSKDETKLRRKAPLRPPKYDPDDCMIYVECLPKKTDHDWLKRTFSQCGQVVYVSLPRYKSTNDIKGFAFVEFETPQEACFACELMNNPPPDSRARVGKFPTMRGRKRIMPVNFDSGIRTREEVLPRYQQQRQDEDRSEMRRDRDPPGKYREDAQEGMKTSDRTEKQDDTANKGQKRKRALDDLSKDSGGHGNQSKTEQSEKKMKDSTKEMIGETKKLSQESTNESSVSRNTRKRKHDDNKDEDVKDDISKSAKRDSSLKGSEKRDNRVMRDQNKETEKREDEDAEEAKEETAEQRRLRILQMGRKMMKRKRSLSEGDKWAVRFRNEEEEEEEEGEKADQGTEEGRESIKRAKTAPSEATTDGNGQDSTHDTSRASDLERKKRSRKKKLGRQVQEEEESLFLRVISKREWLDLRQEYLDLQKQCLVRFKHPYRNQAPPPSTTAMAEPHLQPISDTAQTHEETVEAPGKERPTGPEYVSGTVLTLTCFNPTVTRKDIKEHLESLCPVAYIDLPDGEVKGHVRFQTAEGPKTVLAKDTTAWQITLSLISAEEEKAYWEKLRLDRENKLKSKHSKKKKRGTNKVQQKAERALAAKTKTHIRFDE